MPAMKHVSPLLLALSLWSGTIAAEPLQAHAAIRAAAEAYLQTQTRNLPGEVQIQVGGIDPRLTLAACPALQAWLPPGAKLFGHTTIGVRCAMPKGWTILVPATIRVSLDLLVANKPLLQGSIVSEADFTLQRGEMDRPGLLTSPQQAIGQTLKYAIGAGQVLRVDMLREPWLIRQGQTVNLIVHGAGYALGNEGQALNDAAAGAAVRIRLASGQVMTARAAGSGVAELMR
ncbi:flagellar basal body P-ring formation chaperone FlgA [Ferrigenium sp. UT5]